MKRYLCFIAIFLHILSANANQETYFDEHSRGWHWYEDPVPEDEELDNPVTEMNALKATITQALDKAILHPTQENVKTYIELQNKVSHQSSAFSGIWQEVLLQSPELNYALVHPTNALGKQVDTNLEQAKEDKAIQTLAQKSGLFFFYHSSCPYCQRFAPIVKEFSDRYGLSIIPITTDGISLPEFPNSKINNGQAAKFQVKVEPALFAVNPYTHKAYPVGYGLMTEDELRKRILDIATHFSSEEQ